MILEHQKAVPNFKKKRSKFNVLISKKGYFNIIIKNYINKYVSKFY